MQLTDKTITLLKNFASIQPNLVVTKGNTIKTIAEAKNIIASATLEQEFPVDFGIYDLDEFLGVLDLVDSPTLVFDDDYLTVSDSNGTSKVRYYYSAADNLTTMSKEVSMPNTVIELKLTKATLEKIRRASAALGHDKLLIQDNDGSISLSVTDLKDDTSNSFTIEVPGTYEEGAKFSMLINIANFKLVPDDYTVYLADKLISKFESASGDVNYLIALDKSSTYEGGN